MPRTYNPLTNRFDESYGRYFYYAAPFESQEYIESEGILVPREVHSRVKEGSLPKEVIGVSFDERNNSNYPDYVSLTTDSDLLCHVISAMCYSRYRSFYYPDFRVAAYAVSSIIASHPNFKNNDEALQLNSEAYPGEVLYHGRIPKEFIEDVFCVRSHFR